MPRLTQESILALQDRPTIEVDVPEWGGTLALRMHGIREVIGLNEAYGRFPAEMTAPVYLSFSIVDEAGRRLFADDEAIYALADRHPKTLIRLFDLASKLNEGEDARAREKHEDAAGATDVPAGGSLADAGL